MYYVGFIIGYIMRKLEPKSMHWSFSVDRIFKPLLYETSRYVQGWCAGYDRATYMPKGKE